MLCNLTQLSSTKFFTILLKFLLVKQPASTMFFSRIVQSLSVMNEYWTEKSGKIASMADRSFNMASYAYKSLPKVMVHQYKRKTKAFSWSKPVSCTLVNQVLHRHEASIIGGDAIRCTLMKVLHNKLH